MPSRYLTAIYQDGGRELPSVDCWGLTTIARSELYGLPGLSKFGEVTRLGIHAFQRSYRTEVGRALERCEPFPGAIAAAMKGDICAHVALVVLKDDRLQVLEINPGSGARIIRLQEFKDNYMTVVFYRDRDLCKQA